MTRHEFLLPDLGATTYRSLVSQVESLAAKLCRSGLEPGETVAIRPRLA